MIFDIDLDNGISALRGLLWSIAIVATIAAIAVGA